MFTNKRVKHFVIIIGLAVISLSIILTLNGPRLISAERQGSLASTTFIGKFNTNLSKTEPLIVIEPAIEHSATIQGNILTIEVKEPLLSNTSYKIEATVADLRNKQTTVTMVFETPGQEIAYLRRMYDGEPDEIYKKTIGSDKENLIYSDFMINDFAMNERNEIAVITEKKSEDVKKNVLLIVDNKNPTSLQLPKGEPLSVTSTHASTLFAIRSQDPKTFENYLFIYDSKTKIFQEITDSKGMPIHASNIMFAPDGKTIIYQDARDNALYIDELFDDRGIFSFGVVNRLMRYMPDDSGIFVEKIFSEYEYISSNGERTRAKPQTGIIEKLPLMTNKGDVILRTDYGGDGTTQSLIIIKNDQTEVKNTTSYAEKVIDSLSISPNDEFISNYEATQPVIYDTYSNHATPKNNHIIIRDLSGLPIEVIAGSHLQWL